jgi:hypothetical protein
MNSRQLFWLGVAAFIGFFVLAIAFYKERAVFLDISFHLFSILKDDTFAIQNNRFAAFFTQLFPLFGSNAGLSLSALSLLYTLSFLILHAIVFFVILLKLKNARIALAYLVYLVIMTAHTFYWIQSEMPQGAAFLFLFAALLDNILSGRTTVNNTFLFAAPLLMFTFSFAHPLLLFPFAFIMLFFLIHYYGQRRFILSLAAAGVIMFLIKSIFMMSSYDQTAMSGVDNMIAYFPNYFDHASNRNFIKYIFYDYYFLLIGLIGCLVYYFISKQILKGLLLFCFFIGYCFLINISYPQGGDQFYMENLYLNLGIMVGIPLAFDVFPSLTNRRFKVALGAMMILVCMIRIFATHPLYTARLEWQRNILSGAERTPNKKWVLSPSSWPKDTLLMSWASSYEFWLLSTMERGYSASIIIEETPGEFDWAMQQGKGFITKWGVFDHAELNPRYFIFRDTVGYIKPPDR